jgi:predicted DsbA family dithiol-disulfide isomerase/uncharacterized membrane protein
MLKKRSLTLDGLSLPNGLNILLAVATIGISIYLTNYFFTAHFPQGLNAKSGMCDINSIFTCSGATLSPVSNIMGMPVSFLGILVGLSFLLGSIFPSEAFERTNKFLSYINVPGVLFFLVYSLTVLGTICPMCSLYYVFTLISAFLYWKYGVDGYQPHFGVLGGLGAIAVIGGILFSNHYSAEKAKMAKLNDSVIMQFNKLNVVGDPEIESPYKIVMATEKFSEAPIRISVYSDFECPFCAVTAKQVEEMAKNAKYKGKINIQYFFYPLDNYCNPGITRKFHEFACKAAYLAGCDSTKFLAIHDEIFHNQKNLDDDFLQSLEAKHGLKDCQANQSTKDFVAKSIASGDKLGINSTPTLFINGRKIEGSIPNEQFYAIFDSLLNN